MIGRILVASLLAALVGGIVVASSADPGVAQTSSACNELQGASQIGEDPGGTTPIVLVHGFVGSQDSWFNLIDRSIDDDIPPLDPPRSFADAVGWIDGVSVWTFDYSDTSTKWVTNETISGGLADLLTCLSEAGAYPSVVVAHSMGGLAARQAISRLGDSSIVSGLVTFATPHLGSDTAAYVAAALDSDVSAAVAASIDPYGVGSVMWMWFRAELEACWDLKTQSPDAQCENFGGWPPLGSEAGEALQTGSTELSELPLLPDHINTLAIAGNIDIAAQSTGAGPLPVIGWWYQDVAHFSVGDTIVSVPSATDIADEIETRTCQLNLKSGYAFSDDFRQILGINYDDGKERPITQIADVACQHSNLARTVEFTNQALGFINTIVEGQRQFQWSADGIVNLPWFTSQEQAIAIASEYFGSNYSELSLDNPSDSQWCDRPEVHVYWTGLQLIFDVNERLVAAVVSTGEPSIDGISMPMSLGDLERLFPGSQIRTATPSEIPIWVFEGVDTSVSSLIPMDGSGLYDDSANLFVRISALGHEDNCWGGGL